MSALDIVVDWNSTSMDLAMKMVIMTSCLLSDAHQYILCCLSTHQTVLCCTIFTSISEIAHSAYVDSTLGPDAFCEYESLLLQDYEEIVRKSETKDQNSPLVDGFSESPASKSQERLVEEYKGWSPFACSEEDVSNSVTTCSRRDFDEVNSMNI